MAEERDSSVYRVTRGQAENGLDQIAGRSLVYNDLSWEGSGPEGKFVVEENLTSHTNSPLPPFKRLTRHFVDIGFLEVRDQFFPGIALSRFAIVTASVDSTFVTFDLNGPEV